MKKILVTGANGQLGLCLKSKYEEEQNLEFIFLDSKSLDITNENKVKTIFNSGSFDFCINCAAYTAVDTAEDEKEIAYNINVIGAKNLAEACNTFNVTLIHFSTDFVFDGSSKVAYKETGAASPLGVYGFTKLKGEEAISTTIKKYYIIRTSWLYSEFRNNFVKTMLRLAAEKEELNVVNDQIGTPTNANDLAAVIIKIIKSSKQNYGLYHFSNLGETTWYGFAKAIFNFTKTPIKVNAVTSKAFVTKAERPKYSVLDKTKISDSFSLKILDWKESLENHIKTTYL
ncbi:dTDP-4-dehydrorhamnose reductase [Lacinutrix sp.]|uniref:dTDP-4-dehydrorhamnose reductase n=1 Tax=Lacinutrix sp. TaxID=1937692 RepID=UPI0025BC4496|nr:dTDP-4-dehydrorhamnose reductase [Lacinutrix sp.]